jgi:hypothetical protein
VLKQKNKQSARHSTQVGLRLAHGSNPLNRETRVTFVRKITPAAVNSEILRLRKNRYGHIDRGKLTLEVRVLGSFRRSAGLRDVARQRARDGIGRHRGDVLSVA